MSLRVRDAVRLLDAVLIIGGAAVLFAMMTLTFVDVVMRYVFNASLRGAFEVTELMMVLVIYLGLPLVSRHGEHVTMDVLERALPPATRRVNDVVVEAACAVLLAAAAWLVWRKAGQLAALGDTTAALRIVLAPFVYLMSVLIAATAMVHVARSVGRARGRGEDGPPSRTVL